MTTTIVYTKHAIKRQAHRNLSEEDVQFVFVHGHRIYCAGALHIFLARRDIPNDPTIYRRFARLEGTVLVMSINDDKPVLITVYRNRRGFKEIRAKSTYDRSIHSRFHKYRNSCGSYSESGLRVVEE
jgi:hypothetical protein